MMFQGTKGIELEPRQWYADYRIPCAQAVVSPLRLTPNPAPDPNPSSPTLALTLTLTLIPLPNPSPSPESSP